MSLYFWEIELLRKVVYRDHRKGSFTYFEFVTRKCQSRGFLDFWSYYFWSLIYPIILWQKVIRSLVDLYSSTVILTFSFSPILKYSFHIMFGGFITPINDLIPAADRARVRPVGRGAASRRKFLRKNFLRNWEKAILGVPTIKVICHLIYKI